MMKVQSTDKYQNLNGASIHPWQFNLRALTPFIIWLFIHGLTSKDLEISWRALFKEGELGTSTPLQDIIGSIMILSSMLYGFFGMGMFWDYLEAASLFLMNQ